MALFRAGHDEAFRVIHDRYRQRLFAYARQMLSGSRQDAEDALQDIFVRAYAGLRASDRELALRAWLYRIAHNRCIDELRRPSPPPPEVLELVRSPIRDPTEEAEQRESLRRLLVDVQRLPEQQRSALLMRELGGMAYADVATSLDVSVPAVKSLLVRARVGLTQALAARDTACSEIREELIVAHDRGVRPGGMARRHMRDCSACREFRGEIRGVSRQFAALVPALGPLGLIGKLLGVGGVGGGAGGGAAASSGAAAGGTAAAAGSAGAASVGLLGAGHVATLLAAAVVTAGGAVEVQHTIASTHHHHARHLMPAAVMQAPEPAASITSRGAQPLISYPDPAAPSAAPAGAPPPTGSRKPTLAADQPLASVPSTPVSAQGQTTTPINTIPGIAPPGGTTTTGSNPTGSTPASGGTTTTGTPSVNPPTTTGSTGTGTGTPNGGTGTTPTGSGGGGSTTPTSTPTPPASAGSGSTSTGATGSGPGGSY